MKTSNNSKGSSSKGSSKGFTYKEPKSYFNSDMKKAASAYDKKNGKK